MASLKELRNRINSVKSTQKITSAMKMVAGAKLTRAQAAAEAARPYADRMERMLGSLAANVPSQESAPRLMAGSGEDKVHLIVVMTSDRGLCGSFNSQIVRGVRQHIRRLLDDGKEVKLLCVGRKGRDQLRREYGNRIVDSITEIGRRDIEFAEADDIAGRLARMFEDGEFDVCTVAYNTFRSAMSQDFTLQQLIPFPAPEEGPDEEERKRLGVHDYEPDETEILEQLLPRNLAMQVFRALLENYASEQGARMTAMDSATRNAGEMIDKLTLTYNRTRQAQITKELIEIISGAEAL